jgi:hypothetical protein
VNKKIIIASLIFVFFVLLIAPFLLLGTLDSISYFKQPSFDLTDDVYGTRTFEQEFRSYKNNLAGLGLSIRNPALRSKKNINLEVYDGSKPIRTVDISGSNIADGTFIKVAFLPIGESQSKNYKIVITSPDSIQNDSFSISLSKNNTPELGDLLIDGIERDEKMAMIGFYKIDSKYSLFSFVFGDFIKRMRDDNSYLIFYLMLLTFLIIKVLILNKK